VLPAQLVEEVAELHREGWAVELTHDAGLAAIVVRGYPLPEGYSTASTTLLLRFPLSYPNGQPDMFWTDPETTLADGRSPQGADVVEEHLGRPWRRFSWHLQRWNPGTDDLKTYLEFVNTGLKKAAT
jgi:hypothetical protein